MKLHATKLAFAAALAMTIFYIGCALYSYLFPTYALQLTADLLHLSNLRWIEAQLMVTPVNFISGLLQSFVYTYIYAFLLAWFYNRLIK